MPSEDRLIRSGLYVGRAEPLDPNEDGVGKLAALLADMFGDTCWDDSVDETAQRVMKYWREMSEFSHRDDIPGEAELPFKCTVFPATAKQMVLVNDIEFASLCAHHLLPFIGRVHVAYIPSELQIGLSKIPRLVDFWAKRPQVQENLTYQIAEDLKKRLKAQGVMVVVEAQHTCMCARGVRKHNGMMRTSLPLGVFLSNPAARDEMFHLLGLARS